MAPFPHRASFVAASPPHPWRRPGATVVWVVVAALVTASSFLSAAGAGQEGGTTDEAQLLALTNDLRETVGAPPLDFDGSASEVARQWAEKMAEDGELSHNPDLQSQLPPGWTEVGENVAMGGAVDEIHRGLVGSPHHYDNLVYPGFNRVGLAVVRRGVQLYVVEDFLNAPAAAPGGAAATGTPGTTGTAATGTAGPTVAPSTSTTGTTVLTTSTSPSATTVGTTVAATAEQRSPDGAAPGAVPVVVGPPDAEVAVKEPVSTTRIAYVLAQLRAWDRRR